MLSYSVDTASSESCFLVTFPGTLRIRRALCLDKRSRRITLSAALRGLLSQSVSCPPFSQCLPMAPSPTSGSALPPDARFLMAAPFRLAARIGPQRPSATNPQGPLLRWETALRRRSDGKRLLRAPARQWSAVAGGRSLQALEELKRPWRPSPPSRSLASPAMPALPQLSGVKLSRRH